MSHFVVVVVTDKPGDVESALAPFDENLDVDPYREVYKTVSDAAQSARSFWLDYPQYVPESVMALRGDAIALDTRALIRPKNPDAKYGDLDYETQGNWCNQDDAKAWLKALPDDVLALAYCTDGSGDNTRVEGENVVYDSTRNPDGHWDWWTIGGRWRGYFDRAQVVVQPGDRNPGTFVHPADRHGDFLDPSRAGKRILAPGQELQPGDALLGRPGSGESLDIADGKGTETYTGRADQLQWRDVDMDASRARKRAEAEAEYDRYEDATAGVEPPPWTFRELADRTLTAAGLPTEWKDFYASEEQAREDGDEDWRKAWDDAMCLARKVWHEHPWITALHKARLWSDDDDITWWCVRTGGRAEYVRRATARACVPYAIVHNGEWIAKGRMGWFGMSDDKVTQDDWNASVQAFYAQLPPDVWVTAVDCHV